MNYQLTFAYCLCSVLYKLSMPVKENTMQVLGFKILTKKQIRSLIKTFSGVSFKEGDIQYVYICNKPGFILDTIEEIQDDDNIVWYYLEMKAWSNINNYISFKGCWIKINDFEYFLNHDVTFHIDNNNHVVLEDIGHTTLNNI